MFPLGKQGFPFLSVKTFILFKFNLLKVMLGLMAWKLKHEKHMGLNGDSFKNSKTKDCTVECSSYS